MIDSFLFCTALCISFIHIKAQDDYKAQKVILQKTMTLSFFENANLL